MPRASNIYVLQRRAGGVIAAWTVKHEMESFIASREMPRKSIEIIYEVVRLRDGRPANSTVIPWKDIP
jgi:hypothetical protein